MKLPPLPAMIVHKTSSRGGGGRIISTPPIPPTIKGPLSRIIGTIDIDGAGTTHPLPECNPFMLLDEGIIPKSGLPPFGAHPHRGHSVVTLLLRGKMKSWDSFEVGGDAGGGGGGTIIQGPASYWVDAASGIFHDETSIVDDPSDSNQHIQLFQLWVTVKEEDRLKKASLQYDTDLPVVELMGSLCDNNEEGGGEGGDAIVAKAIYFIGNGGKIQTPHPITVAYVTQRAGSTLKFPIESSHGGFVVHMEGCAVYGRKGEGDVNDNNEGEISLKNAVLVLDDASDDSDNYLQITTPAASVQDSNGGGECKYLICTGEKINEPWYKKLAANGAIVAKSEEEAREIALKVEEYAKNGLEGGGFAPFGVDVAK